MSHGQVAKPSTQIPPVQLAKVSHVEVDGSLALHG